MTKKKSKFMTFIWSLIPGAGEMYLGFFKQGVSLMTVFCALLGISGFLQLAFLTYLAPIVWFYSFFHANNLNSLNDEEFYSIEKIPENYGRLPHSLRSQHTLERNIPAFSAVSDSGP